MGLFGVVVFFWRYPFLTARPSRISRCDFSLSTTRPKVRKKACLTTYYPSYPWVWGAWVCLGSLPNHLLPSLPVGVGAWVCLGSLPNHLLPCLPVGVGGRGVCMRSFLDHYITLPTREGVGAWCCFGLGNQCVLLVSHYRPKKFSSRGVPKNHYTPQSSVGEVSLYPLPALKLGRRLA